MMTTNENSIVPVQLCNSSGKAGESLVIDHQLRHNIGIMNRNTIIVIACFVITIWCFFLPWARIGFLDLSTVSVTGFDMIKGVFGGGSAVLANNPVSEVLALLAAIVLIGGLVTCFFKYRAAIIVRTISGLAGAALMFALSYTIPSYITSLSEFNVPTSFLPGYWLAIATFIIAGIISLIVLIANYLEKRQASGN